MTTLTPSVAMMMTFKMAAMMTMTVVPLLLTVCPGVRSHSSYQITSADYCNMEVLNISCPQSQLIVIESAKYGRMKIGRCMRNSYGQHGCSVDALPFLDSTCSGLNTCSFQVPDMALYKMTPCPPDFTSYLEVSHYCISVVAADPTSCQSRGYQKVSKHQHGFISSSILDFVTDQVNFEDSSKCPWVVEVLQGQRINVSLHNILSSSYNYDPSNRDNDLSSDSSNTSPLKKKVDWSDAGVSQTCFEVGSVVDGIGNKIPVSVCNTERLIHVTLSHGHVVRLEFADLKVLRGFGRFLFEFKATGCPNMRPLPNSWHQKDGDTLVARCNHTLQSWHLICKGTEWVGEAGNCSTNFLQSSENFKSWSLEQIFSSEESFPFGVLLAVSIGVAMGIVIGGFLLCLITVYLKRQRQNSLPPLNGYIHPKEQYQQQQQLQQQQIRMTSQCSPMQVTRMREPQRFYTDKYPLDSDSRGDEAEIGGLKPDPCVLDFVGGSMAAFSDDSGRETLVGNPSQRTLEQQKNQGIVGCSPLHYHQLHHHHHLSTRPSMKAGEVTEFLDFGGHRHFPLDPPCYT